mmetsp:Transcript_2246/g.5700  ORF Transcript_2246/g.5700 Transcript_2246/m.5700 type:complete len:200 (-) Transcript_2246:412-1011(-)
MCFRVGLFQKIWIQVSLGPCFPASPPETVFQLHLVPTLERHLGELDVLLTRLADFAACTVLRCGEERNWAEQVHQLKHVKVCHELKQKRELRVARILEKECARSNTQDKEGQVERVEDQEESLIVVHGLGDPDRANHGVQEPESKHDGACDQENHSFPEQLHVVIVIVHSVGNLSTDEAAVQHSRSGPEHCHHHELDRK